MNNLILLEISGLLDSLIAEDLRHLELRKSERESEFKPTHIMAYKLIQTQINNLITK